MRDLWAEVFVDSDMPPRNRGGEAELLHEVDATEREREARNGRAKRITRAGGCQDDNVLAATTPRSPFRRCTKEASVRRHASVLGGGRPQRPKDGGHRLLPPPPPPLHQLVSWWVLHYARARGPTALRRIRGLLLSERGRAGGRLEQQHACRALDTRGPRACAGATDKILLSSPPLLRATIRA